MKALAPLALLSIGLVSVALAQGAHRPPPSDQKANEAAAEKAKQASLAQDAVGKRLMRLEKAFAAEQAVHAETRALLDQTVAYLRDRADRSQQVIDALNAAETEGFTAGINFRSRELLLAGLRAGWDGAESGLPRPPAVEAAPEEPTAEIAEEPEPTPATSDES